MVMIGHGSYAYWGRGPTYKSGDPSTQTHHPFNPSLQLDLPTITYNQKKEATADKLIPNLIWDEQLVPGVITLESRFRDPFVLGEIFGYKGVPGTWAGDGSDIITMNHSNLNNLDKNLWLQAHIYDFSGLSKPIDILYDGGQPLSYEWNGGSGKPLVERAEWEFAECDVNTQPVNIASGYDDGSFDRTGAAEVSTIVAVAAASITNNTYFHIMGITAAYVRTLYHVWFNKDAGGVDPAPSGSTAIEVAVTTGQSAQTISDAITAAITAKADFGAANGGGTSTTITVTNANNGDVRHIVDVDSGLTVATSTYGELGQNGGWSNWDGGYVAANGEVALSKNCTISIADADVSGIDIADWKLVIGTPKSKYFTSDSLKVTGTWLNTLNWYAELTGKQDGNDALSEFLATISSKTKATFKIQYGTTKYLQFTNSYYKESDPLSAFGPAGEAVDLTYRIEPAASSVLTYYWTATETHDPSNYINHTNT